MRENQFNHWNKTKKNKTIAFEIIFCCNFYRAFDRINSKSNKKRKRVIKNDGTKYLKIKNENTTWTIKWSIVTGIRFVDLKERDIQILLSTRVHIIDIFVCRFGKKKKEKKNVIRTLWKSSEKNHQCPMENEHKCKSMCFKFQNFK